MCPGPVSTQSPERRDDGSESAGSESESDDEGVEGYRKGENLVPGQLFSASNTRRDGKHLVPHAGGYHPVFIGEKFKDGRYVVLRKLGWGHFSTVWLVRDTETGVEAALKVIQMTCSVYLERSCHPDIELAQC